MTTSGITEIRIFHTEEIPGEDPKMRIVAEDQGTGTVIDGRALEAQYRCDLGFLLITTDDNPYEETLHIRLLDSEYRQVDAVDLRQMYHAGILSNIEIAGPGSIRFSFFGEDCWRLDIAAHASLRWDVHPFASVSFPGGRLQPHFLSLTRIDRS